MALAAVADDRHLLRLDQVHIGITIVIDAHGGPFLLSLLAHRFGISSGAPMAAPDTKTRRIVQREARFTAPRRRGQWRRRRSAPARTCRAPASARRRRCHYPAAPPRPKKKR